MRGTLISRTHPDSAPVLRAIPWSLIAMCLGCACGHAPASNAGGGIANPPLPIPALQLSAPAEHYSTTVEATPRIDPLAFQLAAAIDSTRKKHGQAPLVHDARLDRAAYDIAKVTGAAKVPASATVALLLTHHGLVELEPNLFLIKGSDGAEASAIEELRKQLANVQDAVAWRRGGIGVLREPGAWTIVLVFQGHHLDLDPLPRRIPSGGQQRVAGRVLGTYHSPAVLLTSPQGAVRRLVTSVQRNAFSARLECNLGDGVYQVEVMAERPSGPAVLAIFPVYCGVMPPSTFVTQASTDYKMTNPGEAERQLLDLMNRDRAANGLPILAFDPRLAQIARRYSQEMAESGDVVHISRRSGSVVDRVRAAGITPHPTVIAENVGRDSNPADAERGFMSSPGHRDNILSRQVTHVGVGIAMGRPEGGLVPLFFTQVFAGWGQ
jgi:uncharacterized protein YkwD